MSMFQCWRGIATGFLTDELSKNNKKWAVCRKFSYVSANNCPCLSHDLSTEEEY